MDLRPAFQIPTLIKALTDVVLPAVDPDNKLAQEQAQLVIGTLHLIAQRLSLQYRYDRHELAHFLALAESLSAQADGVPEASAALRSLASSVEAGREVLDRARADPGELEAANLDLREKLGEIITAASSGADDARLKTIGASVTAHAKELLLRERAWLSPQGWESAAAAFPPIETLIGD
ncbi:MAG: hypothetical protein ACT4PZ_15745 [Panacagrimonas sp.]